MGACHRYVHSSCWRHKPPLQLYSIVHHWTSSSAAVRAGGTRHLFIIHRGHSTTFVPMHYVVSYYNRGHCIPTWLAAAAIA
eukprot:scaffold169815_cov67-Attheya_sp.AAC.2